MNYAALLILPALLLRRIFGLRFIGLTGGIASGKSSVSSYLRETLHWSVIDFDEISREVVEPNHPSGALEKIRRKFGDEVIQSDGRLNREALGKLIFNDPSKRAQLNGIMRIPIWASFARRAANLFFSRGVKEIILDVPLLFEAKLNLVCSETIVVYVNPDVQKERLMKRGQSIKLHKTTKILSGLNCLATSCLCLDYVYLLDSIESSVAGAKIGAQWSLERKAKLADIVIDNNGDLQQLRDKLSTWNSNHKQSEVTKWIPTVPSILVAAILTPVILTTSVLLRYSTQ